VGFNGSVPFIPASVTIPAPAGYTEVVIGTAGCWVDRRGNQTGAPGVHGVVAQAWIDSANATSVVIAGRLRLNALDQAFQSDGVINVMLTFYGPA
ncbi:MAG: hypothetical protein RLZZ15_2553, partial [Verrucomicrobiota bacterium]|jgi:hypothetical protein